LLCSIMTVQGWARPGEARHGLARRGGDRQGNLIFRRNSDQVNLGVS